MPLWRTFLDSQVTTCLNLPYLQVTPCLSFSLLGLFEDLLDYFLLLNQECTYYPIFDAVRTSWSPIRTLNRFLWSRDGGILARSKRWNLWTTWLVDFYQAEIEREIQEIEFDCASWFDRSIKYRLWCPLTPGNFIPQSPHFGAEAFFLMWRYLNSPPGVLMIRTLLDLVL